MTILLIIGLVFGMMCWVGWRETPWWDKTTFVEHTPIISEERWKQMQANGWQVLDYVNIYDVEVNSIVEPGEWTIMSSPTYSTADDLELRIGIASEDEAMSEQTVTKATVLGENCAMCKHGYIYVPRMEPRCDEKSERERWYWDDGTWLLDDPPHTHYADSVCPKWKAQE